MKSLDSHSCKEQPEVDMTFLAVCLILSFGHVIANHKCSQEKAVTCDSSGNTSLDTHAWYERYKDECRWTIKDKDGTVIRELTPSPNTNVQCTLPEIHLSINCIIPKRVDSCICYKLQSTEALYSYGATRNHFQWEVVALCVLWWMCWCWCWN